VRSEALWTHQAMSGAQLSISMPQAGPLANLDQSEALHARALDFLRGVAVHLV
jgi:hypothetical protein